MAEGTGQLKLKRYHPITPEELVMIKGSVSSSLDLSHKVLHKCIGDLPGFAPTLLHLNLQSNSLSHTDLTSIMHLKSLIHLNISNNPIELDGLKMLSNLRNLQHLNISRICKVPSGNSKKAQLDVEAIRFVSLSFEKLRYLNLGYNNLGSQAEYGLFNELKELEELDLCENGIGEAKEFTFQSLTKLRTLNLRSNELTPQLAPLLSKLPNIENLSLAYNYFQEDSIIPLLPYLSKLTSLNLSYNFVSNTAVIEIAKHCKLLKKLDLRSCRCTLQGLEEILKQLKDLEYLSVSTQCTYIDQNEIGFPDNAQVVDRVIGRIKQSKLQTLQIQNNRLYKKQRVKMLLELTGLTVKAGY